MTEHKIELAPMHLPGRRVAALYLRLSVPTLKRKEDAGQLTGTKDANGSVRFTWTELDRFAAARGIDPDAAVRRDAEREAPPAMTERALEGKPEAVDAVTGSKHIAAVDGTSVENQSVVRAFGFMKDATGDYADVIRAGVIALGEPPDALEANVAAWFALEDKFIVSRGDYDGILPAEVSSAPDLRGQVTAMRDKMLEHAQQLRVARDQVSRLELERENSTKQVTQLNQQLQLAHTKVDAANHGKAQAEAALQRIGGELAAKRSKLNESEQELAAAVTDCNQALGRADDADAQAEEWRNRCLRAEALVADAQSNAANREDVVKAAQAAASEAQKIAKDAQAALQEAVKAAAAAEEIAQEQARKARGEVCLANAARTEMYRTATEQIEATRSAADAKVAAQQAATQKEVAELRKRLVQAEDRAKQSDAHVASAQSGLAAALKAQQDAMARQAEAEARAATAEKSDSLTRAQLVEARTATALLLLGPTGPRKAGSPRFRF